MPSLAAVGEAARPCAAEDVQFSSMTLIELFVGHFSNVASRVMIMSPRMSRRRQGIEALLHDRRKDRCLADVKDEGHRFTAAARISATVASTGGVRVDGDAGALSGEAFGDHNRCRGRRR